MGKTFYTERDIEDMARGGQRSLVVSEDVVLTDLAYEAARKLKVALVQPNDKPPAAPERPYLNQQPTSAAAPAAQAPSARLETIKTRVRAAVRERLGDQIDDALLDRVIERVAGELGLR